MSEHIRIEIESRVSDFINDFIESKNCKDISEVSKDDLVYEIADVSGSISNERVFLRGSSSMEEMSIFFTNIKALEHYENYLLMEMRNR